MESLGIKLKNNMVVIVAYNSPEQTVGLEKLETILNTGTKVLVMADFTRSVKKIN